MNTYSENKGQDKTGVIDTTGPATALESIILELRAKSDTLSIQAYRTKRILNKLRDNNEIPSKESTDSFLTSNTHLSQLAVLLDDIDKSISVLYNTNNELDTII